MYTHIMLGSNDLARSRAFYDAVMGVLGMGPPVVTDDLISYKSPAGNFVLKRPINGEPATSANGGTIGFAFDSPAQVDAWHAAGIANGGSSCEDPPGRRSGNMSNLYLAYLRDPDGNKLCAMHKLA